jgi:iron complex transport system ATP-binding protein
VEREHDSPRSTGAPAANDLAAGLVIDGVTARYGADAVLHDVSVSARAGEVTGLIGPNGSGKTTLVRVASRALRPWRGSVRVSGHDPYELSARRAARLVAVVPQDVGSAFSYSALEIVLMGRSPYHSPWGGGSAQDWHEVREAMRATSVEHLADRPFDELSGGERQAVVLAQALAQSAPVMLLDEPTTHLDLRHVVDVLRLLRSLAKRDDKTVLGIFHDLNLAAAYCDQIVALSDGRVAAGGSPEEVITQPLLRDVFGIDARVVPNEDSGKPVVVLEGPDDR